MSENSDHFFGFTIDFEHCTDLEGLKIHSFHHSICGECGSDIAYFEITSFVSIGVGNHKTMRFFDDQHDLSARASPSCDDAFGDDDITMSGIPEIVRFDQQIFLFFELCLDIAAPVFAQKEFTYSVDRPEFPESTDFLYRMVVLQCLEAILIFLFDIGEDTAVDELDGERGHLLLPCGEQNE